MKVMFETKGEIKIGEVVSEKLSGKYLIKYWDDLLLTHRLITKRKKAVKEIQ